MFNFYLIIIVIILNFFLVLNFKTISKIINIRDIPDNKRKFQKHPVYLLGGFFLFINLFIILIIDFFFLKNFLFENVFYSDREYFSFLFGIISFFLFGLYDDKYEMSSNNKLLISALLISITILLNDNLTIEYLNFSFLDKSLELRSFSFFFTIFCFLLFSNALNMFDGINLQAISYSILFFLIFIFKGFFIQLCFFLIIPLIFIFYLNLKDRIYLGETGIQILAFIITFVILNTNYHSANKLFADQIFIIMGLPGLDMFRLFVTRIYGGRHPFKGDNSHIHHYLSKYIGNFFTFLCIFIYILTSIFAYNFVSNKALFLLIYILFYFIIISFLIFNKK